MAPISDVTGIKGEDTFVRTIYAGNAVQTVKSLDPVKILTVRGTAFPPTKEVGGKCAQEAGEHGGHVIDCLLVACILNGSRSLPSQTSSCC